MNKILVITLIILTSFESKAEPPKSTLYCLGYKTGFIDGYCYTRRPCKINKEITCKKPKKEKATYLEGYNIGYELGKN